MRTSNLANEALRHSEVGMVWQEKLSGTAGTVNVPKCSTFRVRAAAACTVTIDGVLAMTMVSGEIAIFNAGKGAQTGGTTTVAIVIVGNCFMQLAADKPNTLVSTVPTSVFPNPVDGE